MAADEQADDVMPAGILAFAGAWTAMMIAMMTPSVLPALLLFRASAPVAGSRTTSAAIFGGGYFVAWGVIGLSVGSLRWIAGSALEPWYRPLGALALVLAGAYQLTRWKRACLDHCRTPTHFFLQHWRPGPAGALLMGIHHGWYCVGCCAGLMVALITLGLMNPWWMAGIALLVMAEKWAPGGDRLAAPAGFALMALGAGVALGVVPISGSMQMGGM